jgi:t-SNARE complex subunit (syntaxin)
MKRVTTTLFAVLFITVLISSCTSGKKRDADFLPPMKIEIPDEIKGDKDLVEIVESSEKAINEFSDNIERIAVDGKDVLNKKDEDLTLMDQMKIAKMAVEFISNSTQMAQALDQFNSYVEKKQSQGIINDAQLKALEQVELSFEKRMEQIETKYDKYYNK